MKTTEMENEPCCKEDRVSKEGVGCHVIVGLDKVSSIANHKLDLAEVGRADFNVRLHGVWQRGLA